MFRSLIAAALFFAPTTSFAQCDFVTSLYAKQMQDPASVERIDIEVNNSKKWAVNGIRMIVDDRENIRPKWKKKFAANVVVSYPFGRCEHSADVRQSGDWRDHIEFVRGKLRQSLDVELNTGNIANAVEFKLFLPETRLGNNETLATLILRKLGILAPKTFMVDVSVNGVESEYLFQEKQSKELLEAMSRREGPMFEGDESLLWSYEDFEVFELEPVSGAKLINKKWAKRGDSSALMAFNAFKELQHSYIKLANSVSPGEGTYFYINPNERLIPSQTFPEYHVLTSAMHGVHALRPHNRKFYWNALAGEFEPMYYDGNVEFEEYDPADEFKSIPVDLAFFKNHTKNVDFEDLKTRVLGLVDEEFLKEFSSLAKMPLERAKTFTNANLKNLAENLKAWSNFTSAASETSVPEIDYLLARQEFVDQNETFAVEQDFLLPTSDPDAPFDFDCLEKLKCETISLDAEQVSVLMADLQYDDQRLVILPSGRLDDGEEVHTETQTEIATVKHSASAQTVYDPVSRELKLIQSRADDWFLIRNAALSDVTVSLVGLEPAPGETGGQQRFNEFGLTGCLTFYNVNFSNTDIYVSDSACEDSLNLVSSIGTVGTMTIKNSYSDAIDLDFSDVTINQVNVEGAGNDCLDVSGGFYVFSTATLKNCGDKGISVGESSQMTGSKVAIETALIGASSKDYSTLKIDDFAVQNTGTCLEAFQKKQEFGGATIDIENENCDRSQIAQDENSTILLGGERVELSN